VSRSRGPGREVTDALADHLSVEARLLRLWMQQDCRPPPAADWLAPYNQWRRSLGLDPVSTGAYARYYRQALTRP